MKIITKLKHMHFFTIGVMLLGMSVMTGCFTTNTTDAGTNDVRAISHDPIAKMSDLIALTNSLTGTKRVAYFVIPMNDQTTQPMSGDLDRQMFPMWTDVVLKCDYTDADGTKHEKFIGTVMPGLTQSSEAPAMTNLSYISIEIPGTYKNTPNSRANVRIDYTKYSSIANFLFANGMEGDTQRLTFDTLEQANEAYAQIKRNPTEARYWNIFSFAPKSFLMKIDFSQIDKTINNESTRVNFSYSRRIGSLHAETGSTTDGEKTIWTPIIPSWARTPFFNDFAQGDIK